MMAVVVAGGLVIGGSALAGDEREATEAEYEQDAPAGDEDESRTGDETGTRSDAPDTGADAPVAGAIGAGGESASEEAPSTAR